MLRTLQPSIFAATWLAAALVLAAALAGCSPGPMIDRLPDNMGLPAGAPARPATPHQYPAVHDMPPVRSTTTMSDEEQFKLEKELRAARDRQSVQQGQAGTAKQAAPAAAKKDVPPTKKQSSDPIYVPPAGVKSNP